MKQFVMYNGIKYELLFTIKTSTPVHILMDEAGRIIETTNAVTFLNDV